MDIEVLKKMLRLEIRADLKNISADDNVFYELKLEDLKEACQVLAQDSLKFWFWFKMINKAVQENVLNVLNRNFEDYGWYYKPRSKRDFAAFILYVLNYAMCFIKSTEAIKNEFDFTALLSDIEEFLKDKKFRITPWKWSKQIENDFLHFSDDMEIAQDKWLSNSYCELLEKKANALDLKCMEKLGYHYYGGSALYSCNWFKARDIFLKMFEICEKNPEKYTKGPGNLRAQIANTLGYIFYYGRTNGKIPEYEKAFEYFSIGTEGGFFESSYKIADMYLKGYGVEKNEAKAFEIISELYDDNFKYLMHGKEAPKLADIALRMGNFYLKGIVVEKDAYRALEFFNLGYYAILRRLERGNWYGDDFVKKSLKDSFDEALAACDLKRRKKKLANSNSDYMAKFFDEDVAVAFNSCENGDLEITLLKLGYSEEEPAQLTFVSYPEYGYAQFAQSGEFYFSNPEKIIYPKVNNFVTANGFNAYEENGKIFLEFLQNEEIVAKISGDALKFKLRKEGFLF